MPFLASLRFGLHSFLVVCHLSEHVVNRHFSLSYQFEAVYREAVRSDARQIEVRNITESPLFEAVTTQ
jgi:hypothetical protein